ncbi:hypothetical protein BDW69DRAFT_194310 [Aspergillus filifer]
MSKFIKSYTVTPKEIFRINNGPLVCLRAYPGPKRPKGVFDLLTYEGKVQPRALNAATYQRTPLPDNLILVHEFRDHYSLQPREEMTVDDLNASITEFLQAKGRFFTKEEWLWKYPKPTETK